MHYCWEECFICHYQSHHNFNDLCISTSWKKSSQQIPCALSPQTMLFTLDKMLSYSKGKIRLLLHNLQIFLRTASKWALGKACKYNLLILFLSQLAFFTTQNTLKHWKQPPNPVANSYSWTFGGGPQKPQSQCLVLLQTSYKMLSQESQIWVFRDHC